VRQLARESLIDRIQGYKLYAPKNGTMVAQKHVKQLFVKVTVRARSVHFPDFKGEYFICIGF
jgi:hypothetical protein